VQLNGDEPPVISGTKAVLPTIVSLGAKSTVNCPAVVVVTVTEAVVETWFASVTVNVTLNRPAVLYVCWTGLPVPVKLSPKFQLKL